MITINFRLNTPSIHSCGCNTALFRHRAGRRLEKGIFVQSGRMYLSQSDPTLPGARTRDFPAAPRLPEILRSGRTAAQLRPCRRGARRHPARRRPPHPHAGEPSRRRAVRARAPERAPQPQGAGLLRGGPAHPAGHRGDHRTPCRRPALPGALGGFAAPSRTSRRPDSGTTGFGHWKSRSRRGVRVVTQSMAVQSRCSMGAGRRSGRPGADVATRSGGECSRCRYRRSPGLRGGNGVWQRLTGTNPRRTSCTLSGGARPPHIEQVGRNPPRAHRLFCARSGTLIDRPGLFPARRYEMT